MIIEEIVMKKFIVKSSTGSLLGEYTVRSLAERFVIESAAHTLCPCAPTPLASRLLEADPITEATILGLAEIIRRRNANRLTPHPVNIGMGLPSLSAQYSRNLSANDEEGVGIDRG